MDWIRRLAPTTSRAADGPPHDGTAARFSPWLIALAAAAIANSIFLPHAHGSPIGGQNDFDQSWLAARLLLEGQDPYGVIRPGGPQGTDYPFYYPLTAAVVTLPLALVPLEAARWMFVTLAAGVLGYAIGRHRPWLWPMLLGLPFLTAVLSSQWSPWLTAAMLVPGLGFLAVAKPNVGLAVLARASSRRELLLLVGGGLAVVALSLAADYVWPLKWRDAVAGAPQFRPLIVRPGGLVLLLGLLRWRDPDARMLLALAVAPQTGLLYEALPVILVARTRLEAAALALMTHLIWFSGQYVPAPGTGFTAGTWVSGTLVLWGCLVPALVLVLLRRKPRAVTG